MGKRYRVTLTGEERANLEGLIGRGKASARKLAHARILLHTDRSGAGSGWQDARVAEAVQVSVRSVERVRRRFVEEWLASALERKPSLRVYTAYGDTINTAARLESANKGFGTRICVSAGVVMRAPSGSTDARSATLCCGASRRHCARSSR